MAPAPSIPPTSVGEIVIAVRGSPWTGGEMSMCPEAPIQQTSLSRQGHFRKYIKARQILVTTYLLPKSVFSAIILITINRIDISI
jgi:hypothetical protein